MWLDILLRTYTMMLMLLIGRDQLLFTKVASESTCTVIYLSGLVYPSCITLKAGRVSILNCKNHKCICLAVAQVCVGVGYSLLTM